MNTNFINNYAIDEGSAILFYAKVNVELSDCEFSNNAGHSILYTFDQANSVYVGNCNFTNNNGTVYSVYLKAISFDILNSNFINNSANNGGALYLDGSGNVVKCNFTGNNATDCGGAIYVTGDNVV